MDVAAGKIASTAELRNFHHDRNTSHVPAGALDQSHRRANRASRSQHVVEHENARPRRKGIGADLESRFAVFQRIALGEDHAREFALFANGQNAYTRVDGGRGCQQKTTGLETGHGVEVTDKRFNHGVDNRPKRGAVSEDRGEVSKQHSR